MSPLHTLSARQIAQAVARRETTVEAVVRAHLERIAALDPELHAWQFLDSRQALAQAREMDRVMAEAKIDLVVLPSVPTEVDELAGTLIENGCESQLGLLVETMAAGTLVSRFLGFAKTWMLAAALGLGSTVNDTFINA